MDMSYNNQGEIDKIVSKVFTGAEVAKGTKNLSPDLIPQEAARIHKQITDSINNTIDVFAKQHQHLLVAQLMALRDGKRIPDKIKVPDGTQITSHQLTLAEMGVGKAATTVSKNMKILQGLGKGTATLDKNISFFDFLTSLGNGLNTLGGHLMEPAVVHLTNLALDRGFYSVQKAGKEAVQKAGITGRVSFEKANYIPKTPYQEKKNDITMTFNNDSIVYDIGVSIKNSTTSDSITGKSMKVNLKREATLQTLINTVIYDWGIISENDMRWYEAGIGAMYEDETRRRKFRLSNHPEIEQSWMSMKQYAKYMLIADLLVGKEGFAEGDFASIIVFNHKVFSMYRILQQITNEISRIEQVSGRGYTETLTQARRPLDSNFKKYRDGQIPEIIRTRLVDTKNEIDKLYKKKISISINLKKMSML